MNATVNNISKFESWVLASRPRTLLAAFVPVIIGTSIAAKENKHNFFAALIALICSILIQVGTNFVNDLYDFYYGADTLNREGQTRALASGLITAREMQVGIISVFLITFLLGLYLVFLSGWVILLVGIVSILAGIAYTAGPYPLAYNGLGDVFVFLFFGLIGTIGTYYVQTLTVTPLVLWASIPVGALITNILVVNNYRDMNEDRLVGKNTLAVKFGEVFARTQYVLFMILSYAVLFIVYFTFDKNLLIFLPLLTLPLSLKLVKMIFTLKGSHLNKTLELTAKLSAIYGILFAIGLLLKF